MSISQPPEAFLTARNEISLLKEIYFLPQRRKFLAAKKLSGGWKTGKNGASDGIFRLSGASPCAKSRWLFVRHPPEWLTRRRTWSAQGPDRTVRTEAEGGNPCHPAFPQRRENRAFPSAPRPSFRPCDSRVSAFDNLTKCHHKPSLVIRTRSISPFFL